MLETIAINVSITAQRSVATNGPFSLTPFTYLARFQLWTMFARRCHDFNAKPRGRIGIHARATIDWLRTTAILFVPLAIDGHAWVNIDTSTSRLPHRVIV